MTQFLCWEDYVYPGTDVLRNKFGLRDAEQLRVVEEVLTFRRAYELTQTPIQGGFDYDHMKAIHHHLFQDVYEWAGQERVGPFKPMTKDYPNVVDFEPGDPAAPMATYGYYPGDRSMTEAAQTQYARLARKDHLKGLSRDEFAHELAEFWGELNVIHSFREGNTRSQVRFCSQLAAQAGHPFSSAHLAPGRDLHENFVAARFHCQATGTSERLEQTIHQLIEAGPATPLDAPVLPDLPKRLQSKLPGAPQPRPGSTVTPSLPASPRPPGPRPGISRGRGPKL